MKNDTQTAPEPFQTAPKQFQTVPKSFQTVPELFPMLPECFQKTPYEREIQMTKLIDKSYALDMVAA